MLSYALSSSHCLSPPAGRGGDNSSTAPPTATAAGSTSSSGTTGAQQSTTVPAAPRTYRPQASRLLARRQTSQPASSPPGGAPVTGCRPQARRPRLPPQVPRRRCSRRRCSRRRCSRRRYSRRRCSGHRYSGGSPRWRQCDASWRDGSSVHHQRPSNLSTRRQLLSRPRLEAQRSRCPPGSRYQPDSYLSRELGAGRTSVRRRGRQSDGRAIVARSRPRGRCAGYRGRRDNSRLGK